MEYGRFQLSLFLGGFSSIFWFFFFFVCTLRTPANRGKNMAGAHNINGNKPCHYAVFRLSDNRVVAGRTKHCETTQIQKHSYCYCTGTFMSQLRSRRKKQLSFVALL